jgi:hypothetical protein
MVTMADIRRIVECVDGNDDSRALPADDARKVEAHQRISGLVRSACAVKPGDARLAFLAQRVIANAGTHPREDLLARLARGWRTFVSRPLLAYGSFASVLIVVIAVALTMSRLTGSAQAARMESFVIYQTDDGNAFVRYFDYREVTEPEDADEAP